MRFQKSSAHSVFAVVFFATSALAPALCQGNPEPEKPKPKITLAVAVTDKDHHPVTGLKAEDFALYENDQPQQIALGNGADIPACIGLLLDSSGSMRRTRNGVVHALAGLVRAGNSNDRFFVVNFNDRPYLDQDLTSDPARIEKAMTRMDPRGGTALYDAVIASADHLARQSDCQKSFLVVVTDGDDNSSRQSLQQTIDALQYATSPVIYFLGVPNEQQPGHKPRDRRALEILTAATGGALFFTESSKDLDKAAQKVAAEIQNQYVVTYVPTAQQGDAGYRKIRLELHAPERKDVVIRVKSGYLAKRPSLVGSR